MIINRKTDALIVVDMQNDFLPGGSLPVPEGDRIIRIINQLGDHFDVIFATLDWHPPTHCSFKENGGTWPKHCVATTKGSDWPDALYTQNFIPVLKGHDETKEAYSGFKETDLTDRLKENRFTRVFVCGLATNYCVKATVLDALSAGFETFLITDAIKGVDSADEESKYNDSVFAVYDMQAAGATLIESSELC